MRNFTRWSLGLVAFSGLLLVSGCGSNDDTPAPTPLATGYLVGNLIEGVPYKCGTEQGRTGRLGQFSYKTGDGCEFKVGKMVLPVTPAKLQKGYVSAYDLTATATEAWTLMAILQSISYWRPGNNLMVVDNNLLERIPLVDLKNGDAAVSAALAPFMGTLTTVSVNSARIVLAQTVNADNSLVISLDSLVAQGKATLDALQIATVSGYPYVPAGGMAAQSKEKNHSESVNLRFYDYAGNKLNFSGSSFTYSHLPIYSQSIVTPPMDTNGLWFEWIYTSPNQNPSGNLPVLGANVGTMQGTNIIAFNWNVGQKASYDAGNAFQNAIFWTNSSNQGSPMTIFGKDANPSAKNDTAYPAELNFFFSVNLSGSFSNGPGNSFTCPNMMFAQSQTKGSLKAVLDFLYDLGDTVLKGVELADTDGTDIEADKNFMGSVKSTIKAAFKLGTEHWWVFGVNAQTPSYRVTINTTGSDIPAIIMPCKDGNGTIIPAVVTSTADDHTFDVHMAFPGQTLKGIGASGCTGSNC